MAGQATAQVIDAQILYTGRPFGGKGFRAVGPVLLELIKNARSELQLLAFVISPGASPLLHEIERAINRGIRTTIVANAVENHDEAVKYRLKDWASKYKHFKLVNHTSDLLHAKVLIADRELAVVGSANFTWSGMVTNAEIGVLLRGPAVWDLATLADAIAMQNEGQ